MSDIPPPASMIDLAGKVVVVTGAAGTIGTGICRRLSEAGASIVAHVHRKRLEAGWPTLVATVEADLTDPGASHRVVESAISASGRIDGLVNNAAIQPTVDLAEMSDAQWTAMIETNLTAVHRLTKAAAERMQEGGEGGSIIHIASIEGVQPAPGHSHYATAKAALIMHGRAAALEFGPAGIRVNTVSPGLIGGDALDRRWPEGVARWKAAAPLGRLGTPEDVGDACVFLCSDLSRWITGVNLVVDGGVLARPTW